MYAGHSFPNPTNLHHGLQPVNTPSATDIGIRGSAPPRDYHGRIILFLYLIFFLY